MIAIIVFNTQNTKSEMFWYSAAHYIIISEYYCQTGRVWLTIIDLKKKKWFHRIKDDDMFYNGFKKGFVNIYFPDKL